MPTTTKEQRNDLDKMVLKLIKAKDKKGMTFREVAVDVAAKMAAFQGTDDRELDRSIQRLRRSGQIETRARRWHLPEKKGAFDVALTERSSSSHPNPANVRAEEEE